MTLRPIKESNEYIETDYLNAQKIDFVPSVKLLEFLVGRKSECLDDCVVAAFVVLTPLKLWLLVVNTAPLPCTPSHMRAVSQCKVKTPWKRRHVCRVIFISWTQALIVSLCPTHRRNRKPYTCCSHLTYARGANVAAIKVYCICVIEDLNVLSGCTLGFGQ